MKEKKLSTKQIVVGGLLVALAVIMSYQNIYLYPPKSGRITLRFIPILYGSILLGPGVGAMIGGIQDILTYFLTPGSPGTFFPGFTITAIIMGIFPSYIMKSVKDKSFWKITGVAVISFFITIVLDSLWLSILMGKAYLYFVTTRIVPNTVQAVITIIVLYIIITRIKVEDMRYNPYKKWKEKTQTEEQ